MTFTIKLDFGETRHAEAAYIASVLERIDCKGSGATIKEALNALAGELQDQLYNEKPAGRWVWMDE